MKTPANVSVGCLGIALLAACSTTRPVETESPIAFDARAAVIVEGGSGERLSWVDLLARVDAADVIVLGEQHDDARGHMVQLAIVEDVAAPGVVVSMEMLDRREQSIVDDYMAGLIDRDQFMEETAATRWRKLSRDYMAGTITRDEFARRIDDLGWDDWDTFYQPIIDAAKSAGAHVVAANAPWARYTSRITIEDGYEPLRELSASQRMLIAWPDEVPTGPYRERFWQFMAGRAEGEGSTEPAQADPHNPHAGSFTDEQVLSGFMKQVLYDTTMADSIVGALKTGASRVVHLVGQFHSDFEGGTVSEVRRMAPEARVLTISLLPESKSTLAENDRGRADIVVYTGD